MDLEKGPEWSKYSMALAPFLTSEIIARLKCKSNSVHQLVGHVIKWLLKNALNVITMITAIICAISAILSAICLFGIFKWGKK